MSVADNNDAKVDTVGLFLRAMGKFFYLKVCSYFKMYFFFEMTPYATVLLNFRIESAF